MDRHLKDKPKHIDYDPVRDLRQVLNRQVYDSYFQLPMYKKLNIPLVKENASQYAVVATLLATLTAAGFLSPIGGYDNGVLNEKKGIS